MVIGEHIIQQSFQEVVSVMTGQLAERVPAQTVDSEIVSMMVLQGQRAVIFALATTAKTAQNLAASTLGLDSQRINEEEGQDTLSEIVNQLAGMTKSRIAKTHSLALSPPFIVTGETLRLQCKKKQEKVDQFYLINTQLLQLSIVYL